MSEKLCLQWNDFKDNAIDSLGSLKDDKDFLDVTLASEDGKQIEAHKVILAMMEKTLRKDNHSNPIYRCIPCGKEAKSHIMKSHIEVNHLEGISIPCNFCEKTFRSRNTMEKHYRKYHKNT